MLLLALPVNSLAIDTTMPSAFRYNFGGSSEFGGFREYSVEINIDSVPSALGAFTVVPTFHPYLRISTV